MTIQEEEAGKKVTIHRRDLGSQDVTADMLGDSDMKAKVREMTGMDLDDLLSNAQSIQSSGKNVSRTTTTTQTFHGDEARKKMTEMGIDLGQQFRGAHPSPAAAAAPTKERGWIGWVLLVGIIGGLGALGWVLNS